MKYVLWGTGRLGERAAYYIGAENIEAFVDSDKQKLGSFFLNRPIISIDKYVKSFSHCFIVVCFERYLDALALFEKKEISQYLLLHDCPGEYLQQEPGHLLIDYAKSVLGKHKFCIHGLTLFSLQIYEWIVDCGGSAMIHFQQTPSIQIKKILEENSINICYGDDGRFDYHLYCYYLTKEERDNLKDNEIYLYDCMDRIVQYHNHEMCEFKSIHDGKRCFVVCTGPSLRMEDLDTLNKNNEICFSLNSIFYAFSYTKWRPDYYFMEDKGGFAKYSDLLDGIEAKVVFLADVCDSYWMLEHPKKIMKYHLSFQRPTNGKREFSDDIMYGVYGGGTVAYSCLQFAAYMGFKEIYILGMDFTLYGDGNKSYKHFYKEENAVKQGDDQWTVSSFVYAKEYLKNKGIKVFNATRGGKLEVFQRVSFDSLFN